MAGSVALHVTLRVGGLARWLSHAETLRVLHRACTRAGVPVQYTQGFNPHPRMSLPLPRPVGVEADADLLCIRLGASSGAVDGPAELGDRLGRELPDGIDVVSARLASAEDSVQPVLVRYLFPIGQAGAQEIRERLRERIAELMEQPRIEVCRHSDKARSERSVDVRPFLERLELRADGVIADCVFSQAGSVRVDELLGLLHLGPDELAGPVRRTGVTWSTHGS